LLTRRVREVVEATASAHGCRAEVTLDEGYPPNVNDARLSAWTGQIACELLGETNCDLARPPGMGGEDFAYYAQLVPACFFYLGLCPPGRDEYPPGHSPNFDFTDDALRHGVAMMSLLTARALRDGLPV
jgi:hippurate hydrolase